MHTIILILHVLGAGILFSLGIFSLVVTSKGAVSKERLITLSIMERLAPLAAIWQLITGISLYLYNFQTLSKDPLFWTKIVLYIVSGFFAGKILKGKRLKLMKQKGSSIKVGNLPLLTIIETMITLTIISLGVILVETT